MSESIRSGRDLFGADRPKTLLPDACRSHGDGLYDSEGSLQARPLEAQQAELRQILAANLTDSGAWASLALVLLAQGSLLEAYACARTGYHRGLDSLRTAGWRGTGPVPWEHVPNRGVLRAIGALVVTADALGESDEVIRCLNLLHDCDPAATQFLGIAHMQSRQADGQ